MKPEKQARLDLHLFISGQVQGVSYRANAARMGITHGLAGWVRNLPDGRVELLAQGEEKNLRNFLAWVHQGPAQARVDHVETHWAPADVELSDFQIRN